ncbi:MAG: hypothetical protein HW379_1485 [Actinobacteria bacterium]|nr:hypothetical protein [Actinomycetota bacterium]
MVIKMVILAIYFPVIMLLVGISTISAILVGGNQVITRGGFSETTPSDEFFSQIRLSRADLIKRR